LAVRRWCRAEAIPAEQFRSAVLASLSTGLSLLIDAVRREFPAAVAVRPSPRGYRLTIGAEPAIEAEARGSLLFPPLLLVGFPKVRGSAAALDRPRAAIGAVAAALHSTGVDLADDVLQELFLNSVANLTLNRLIAGRGLPDTAPEPAWQGHGYFPFPALRRGPNADDVNRFGNLVVSRDRIVFAECEGLVRHLADGAMPACWDPAWSPGQIVPPGLIPLHPWTLRRSRTINQLIDGGWLRLTRHGLDAQPLASQRTCQIANGGYHLKLALDATITGEVRLLYRLNVANAPALSALAERILGGLDAQLSFQADVASFSHVVDGVSPFLSCIVRAPPAARRGETLYPAIELWTGRCRAGEAFGVSGRDTAEDLMAHYARALLSGPCLAWAIHGFGFEPHLQNTLVRIREGIPIGVTLRDLDATIVNRAMLPPDLARAGRALCQAGWDAMPTPDLGRLRLAHALHLGHLATVANVLHRQFGARYARLDGAIQDAWASVENMVPGADRTAICELRSATAHVKRSLSMAVSRSMTMQFGSGVACADAPGDVSPRPYPPYP
jgi:hypothetical protein